MKKTALLIALVLFAALMVGPALAAEDAEFQNAVDLYKAGKYEEVVSVLGGYLQTKPEPRAYYLMGYALYALGRHDEASQFFVDAYLVNPEMSPGDFRKEIGIDSPTATFKPKAKAPAAEAPTPTPEKPVAEALAPEAKPAAAPVAKAVVKPEARPAPAPAPKAEPRPRPRLRAPIAPVPKKTLELPPGMGIPFIAGALLLYLFTCLCIFKIARKTGASAAWMSFIPILQVFPILGAAGRPMWWFILLLIPIVGIVISVIIWMNIAENLGKAKVLGILMLLPAINFLVLIYLAFKGGAGAAGPSLDRLELPELPEDFAEPEVPKEFEEIAEAVGQEPEAPPVSEEDAFFGEATEEGEPLEEIMPDEEGKLPEAEAEEFPEFSTEEGGGEEEFTWPEEMSESSEEETFFGEASEEGDSLPEEPGDEALFGESTEDGEPLGTEPEEEFPHFDETEKKKKPEKPEDEFPGFDETKKKE